AGPAPVDPKVAALFPAEIRQPLAQGGGARLPFRIVLGVAHQHADPSPALARLRPERPRPCQRAAQQGDKVSTSQPLTLFSAGYNACEQFDPWIIIDSIKLSRSPWDSP